jgi:hypothetical protein
MLKNSKFMSKKIPKISIIKSWDAKFMVYKMNFYFSFIQIYDIMNKFSSSFLKSWTFKNQCQYFLPLPLIGGKSFKIMHDVESH